MLIAQHYPVEAEIHLLAVDAAFHGYGIGTSLINAFEKDARNRGIRLIQVKTLGESFLNEPYQRTRNFYQSAGFLPLEETNLWGEDTPCLIIGKSNLTGLTVYRAQASFSQKPTLLKTAKTGSNIFLNPSQRHV